MTSSNGRYFIDTKNELCSSYSGVEWNQESMLRRNILYLMFITHVTLIFIRFLIWVVVSLGYQVVYLSRYLFCVCRQQILIIGSEIRFKYLKSKNALYLIISQSPRLYVYKFSLRAAKLVKTRVKTYFAITFAHDGSGSFNSRISWLPT